MAVYRIFPENDSFISTENVLGNAGKDEIIELGGYQDISGVGQTNRILIKYSTSEIQDVISTKIGTTPYSASIGLYLADAYEVPVGYSIYAYPVYGIWDNGVGKFGDIPTNKTGVSWQYRQANETNAWLLNSFPQYVTASYRSPLEGGGNWYSSSLASGSLESIQTHALNSTHDVNLDVSKAIRLINTSAIDNNGFIIKLSDEVESGADYTTRLKYYGTDTNTIYPPFLEFKWDDSVFNTGSLGVLSNSISTINITNNKGKYPDAGKQRFKIAAKPKHPARSFSTSSIYLTNYALPSASYWGLRDENTEEMIIDFDTKYTKVSCNGTSSFFDVYMDGLQPERYYRILIKTELEGSTVVVDNQNIFKVVRNG
jgi:hypothetical protein